MTNVFEGKPDGRQSDDITHKVSRFRPTYKALSPEDKILHDTIKIKAEELCDLIEQAKRDGRYTALAVTALEESIMWAIKSLTSNG